MKFYIENYNINQLISDCVVVGVFEDGKMSPSAEYLDKCSNHYITSLIKFGDFSGKIGTSLLLYNIKNIIYKRVLLIGCGKENIINTKDLKIILKKTISVICTISVKKILFCLIEIYFKNDNNIYWIIRLMIQHITKYFYKRKQIKNIFTNNLDFYSIILHIINKKNISVAKTALKHALAIHNSLIIAQNISNLPPNICNPLYLSQQSEILSKKYESNITVEVINIEKMIDLGMNAYVAVGNGSQNKPYMSVIKYSSKNIMKEKVIILVGKGVTFDSGGISIKPSEKMHEMKYDMCGAAAAYATMIMVAELKLPLTVISILAGCENMPGGNAFRPGDILTTMSGKTVEVLDTDAEGRLILCDVLTYIERFNPDIVIDIATLTGACVVALGNSVTGFFSNNEFLAQELMIASKQTNDKIWRLPLFKHYENALYSHFADFLNVGKGKAGAITAATFLSFFTKKYNWAHLDIAGTAWKSKTGATGRPVELLCQFLLNQSNF